MAGLTLQQPSERSDKKGKCSTYAFLLFSLVFCCFIVVVVILLVLYLLKDNTQKSLNFRPSNSKVFLKGGISGNEGNVYAWNPVTNIIGPVCDDNWNIIGANIVCKQLGYPGAEYFTLNSKFGLVEGSFSYFVKCFGYEPSLADCVQSDLKACDETEGAGVVCTQSQSTNFYPLSNGQTFYNANPTSTTTTRVVTFSQNKNPYLIGGKTRYEGNVIAYNPSTGISGPVCDDFWSMKDSFVLCRQLGFKSAIYKTTGSAYGNVSGAFSYNNVVCNGSEKSLYDCPHSTKIYCDTNEAAGVICDDGSKNVMLIGGKTSNEGNVYARNPEMDYVGPVCDTTWGLEEALVVCRQLGYDSIDGITSSSYYGYVPTLFTYTLLSCIGYESSFYQCTHSKYEMPECSIQNGAGVSCYNGPKHAKLIGGQSNSEGNIYLFNPTTKVYGPVCDDYWDLYGANVICRQLGFRGALKATTNSYFGQVSNLFSYDNVKCSGNENNIEYCRHKNSDDCNAAEGAGVVCGNTSTVYINNTIVNSSYTGMTKVLVISGNKETTVEVINLKSNEEVCDNLPDFPLAIDGAVGQLINGSVPMFCGGFEGDYPTCSCFTYQNGRWMNKMSTRVCRGYASSVNISISRQPNSSFSIVGGLSRTVFLSNTESLIANSSTWTTQIVSIPDLPTVLAGTCIIKLNETTILLTGGVTMGSFAPVVSKLTFFYTLGDSQWIRGPEMNTRESSRSCGLLKWQNPSSGFQEDIAIVAGGGILQTEVLNLNDYNSARIGWTTSGPIMPYKVYGGKIVQYQDFLIMVGGWQEESLEQSYLYQLKSPTDAAWIQMPIKLKKRRSYHVAMLVPDSIVNCHA